MNTQLFTFILLLSFLVSCQRQVPPSPQAQATLNQCMLCHDNKEMQRGPILDGLQEDYMLRQISKFKSGQRGAHKYDHQGELMATASKDLDATEVEEAVALMARLKPRNYLRTVKGDIKSGQQIYQSQCISCHGEQAEGLKQFKTASLAILEDWYLLSQLRNYKSGRRGYHELDSDGQAMRAIVTPLSDQQLKNVVEYISYITPED